MFSSHPRTRTAWSARMALPATLVTVLALSVAGPAIAQSEAPAESPRPVLLAGASLTLAPFTFIDENGENVGFEIDILEAVGDKLGYDFAYVRIPFEQSFNALNAGIFDVNVNAVFMRCQRLQDPEGFGRFTVPTYTESQAVMARAEDIPSITSFEDLVGKTIGVESLGSTADLLLDEVIASGLQINKETFPDNPSLFLALDQGRVDATMQSELPSLWATRDNPNMGLAFRVPDTALPVGFMFRHDDPRREDFNRALDELKEEGVVAEIYRKWFDEEPDPEGVSAKVVPEVTPEDVCE